MAKLESADEPAPKNLSVEQMQKAITRLKKRIEDVEAFDPRAVTRESAYGSTRALSASIDDALMRTFGNDTADYIRYRSAAVFSYTIVMGRETPLSKIQKELSQGKQRSIELLRVAVGSLQERIDEAEPCVISPTPSMVLESAISLSRVFLVHGHETGPKEAVARYLEKIGLKPIILHEQANKGLTIFEKVENNADVGFAIILLTPDDLGSRKGEESKPRARQNVILELGYFIGKLGRGKICCLVVDKQLELPSDMQGIIWNLYDDGGGWRVAIAKELQAAGYDVDWNIIMSL